MKTRKLRKTKKLKELSKEMITKKHAIVELCNDVADSRKEIFDEIYRQVPALKGNKIILDLEKLTIKSEPEGIAEVLEAIKCRLVGNRKFELAAELRDLIRKIKEEAVE